MWRGFRTVSPRKYLLHYFPKRLLLGWMKQMYYVKSYVLAVCNITYSYMTKYKIFLIKKVQRKGICLSWNRPNNSKKYLKDMTKFVLIKSTLERNLSFLLRQKGSSKTWWHNVVDFFNWTRFWLIRAIMMSVIHIKQ